VVDCSVSAATEDPRFAPVQLEDLPSLDIEISVLSPLEIVKEVGTIEVGTHGLVVSQHGRRGLLLPQVAVQYNWDQEQFLRETCRKAGLATDAWQKGAQIESFAAFVFGEIDRGKAGRVN
jgi:AmmeMemoRadiSam system protein A